MAKKPKVDQAMRDAVLECETLTPNVDYAARYALKILATSTTQDAVRDRTAKFEKVCAKLYTDTPSFWEQVIARRDVLKAKQEAKQAKKLEAEKQKAAPAEAVATEPAPTESESTNPDSGYSTPKSRKPKY